MAGRASADSRHWKRGHNVEQIYFMELWNDHLGDKEIKFSFTY
ncbi:MAG: hypothetical protein AB1643_01120 [Patescibacteria group bacterium]